MLPVTNASEIDVAENGDFENPMVGYQTVDSSGFVGMFTSLALDSNDYPHISYQNFRNGDLKYAGWNGLTWSIQTLGGFTSFTSLALDSTGNPHISYCAYPSSLNYAKWTSEGWIIETVDSGGTAGLYSSLALDSGDTPHVSYYNRTDQSIRYATRPGSTWNIQTVVSAKDGGDNFFSLALDSNDNPHISFYDKLNGDLKYASWTGKTWSIITVDSQWTVGAFPSLAIDSQNNAHISYFEFVNYGLKYAVSSGSNWTIETVDVQPGSSGSAGTYCSLALDSKGNPHISYYESLNGDLRYAIRSDSGWSIRVIDSVGDVGAYSSMALDSHDIAHFSYFDATNATLRYALSTNPKVYLIPPPSTSPSSDPIDPRVFADEALRVAREYAEKLTVKVNVGGTLTEQKCPPIKPLEIKLNTWPTSPLGLPYWRVTFVFDKVHPPYKGVAVELYNSTFEVIRSYWINESEPLGSSRSDPKNVTYPLESTAPQKALSLMTDVLGLDLTPDHRITLRHYSTGSYRNVFPTENVQYELEYVGCKLRFLFRFVEGHLLRISVLERDGLPPMVKSSSTAIDMARDFLSNYEAFSGDSFYGDLRDTLNTTDGSADFTKIFGNAKLKITGNTDIRWIYTANGVDNELTYVSLNFENGFLKGFSDNWRLYVANGTGMVSQTMGTSTQLPQNQSANVLTLIQQEPTKVVATSSVLLTAIFATVLIIKKRRKKYGDKT
jgi:hypothetical protein